MQEAFDLFDLQSAKVTTYNTFTIDGRVHPDFYGEEKEEHPELLSPWKQMRGVVKDLIRGKRTPLSFLLVLRLKEEEKHVRLRAFHQISGREHYPYDRSGI